MRRRLFQRAKLPAGRFELVRRLVGIYPDPRHIILYTSNGEARQEFSIVMTARPVGGQPTTSSESTEVRWVLSADAQGYRMDRAPAIPDVARPGVTRFV